MAFNAEEYWATMQRKYGPNWRDKLREAGSKGGQVKTSKGFGRMTPERVREISIKAGRASQAARRARQNGESN